MARGRPATPLGTYGEISVRQLKSGRYQASLRVRGHDGKLRQIRANGAKPAEAKRRVKEKANDATGVQDTDQLATTSPISELLEFWHDQHQAADSSLEVYQSTINGHINPAIGAVRINEATTARLDAFLRSLPSPATAKRARSILSSAFSLATRYDLTRHNPVRDTTPVTVPRHKARALTRGELATVRRMVAHYTQMPGPGPKGRAAAFPRIVDFLAGTGVRVSEALRLRWEDIDLEATPPTATITVTKDSGKSTRTIQLPQLAADALRDQAAETGKVFEWCFPTGTGKPITKSNVDRWFRQARKAWDEREEKPAGEPDVSWVTTHTFRRSVATWLADQVSLLAASQQLGHADSTITEHHYLERPKAGPAVADVLNGALRDLP